MQSGRDGFGGRFGGDNDRMMAERGAGGAPFFRYEMQKSYDFWRESAENDRKIGRTGRNQRRNESFSQFDAEKTQNEKFFAERRTAQNGNQDGNRRKNQHKLSYKPVEIRWLERDIMLKRMNVNALSFHCAKVLSYKDNRL